MNEHIPTPADGDASAEDAVVERLRAADPAAGAQPDGLALRAAVDERVAAGGTDQLAVARARRWTSWPGRVAAVAAAALVVGGGGGYAVGASGDRAQTPASETITLGAPGGDSSAAAPEMAPMGPSGGGNPLGAESDASAEMGGRSADMSYWPGYGRTVFTSSGLSEEGGTATAWAFDPGAAFTESSIATLAAALGVTGAPVMADGYWSVGPMDGTGPMVSLYADGTASVNYFDPSKDPWMCSVPETLQESAPDEGGGVSGDSGATDSGSTEPGEPFADPPKEDRTTMIAPEPCEQRDLGPAPQGDAALAAARDTLAAVGQDPASYELTAENWGDDHWTYVTAHQVLDGQKSGVTWSFTYTGAGLQSLYGALAPLVALGEYDVVSPAEAVARLTDPRFGGGGGGPIAYLEGSEPQGMDTSVSSGVPTLPGTVEPGSRISWPVSEVTIVDARLGSAMNYQADGSVLLLPSYELISSDGAIWTVIAVADSHLDFTPAG